MGLSVSAKKRTNDTKSRLIFANSYDGKKSFRNKVIGDNKVFSKWLAYLGCGNVVFTAGNGGAYISTDYGEKMEKLEGVSFCKTMWYDAPEKKGGYYTLFIYGKSLENNPDEYIYLLIEEKLSY